LFRLAHPGCRLSGPLNLCGLPSAVKAVGTALFSSFTYYGEDGSEIPSDALNFYWDVRRNRAPLNQFCRRSWTGFTRLTGRNGVDDQTILSVLMQFRVQTLVCVAKPQPKG
jgi:hypothetical protein